jgi:hypothetical protein
MCEEIFPAHGMIEIDIRFLQKENEGDNEENEQQNEESKREANMLRESCKIEGKLPGSIHVGDRQIDNRSICVGEEERKREKKGKKR